MLTKDSTATCPHGFTICEKCSHLIIPQYEGFTVDVMACNCCDPKSKRVVTCGKTMTTYFNEDRQQWEWSHFH